MHTLPLTVAFTGPVPAIPVERGLPLPEALMRSWKLAPSWVETCPAALFPFPEPVPALRSILRRWRPLGISQPRASLWTLKDWPRAARLAHVTSPC